MKKEGNRNAGSTRIGGTEHAWSLGQEKESSISRITGYSDRHSDVWPRPPSGKDLLPFNSADSSLQLPAPSGSASRADPLTWCQGYTEQDRRPSHRSPPWMGNTHPLGYHQVDQGFVGADSQFGQSVCSILLIPSSAHRWRSLRNTTHPRLHLSICFWRIQGVTVGTRGDPRKQEVRWGFGAESPAIWLAMRNPSQCLVAHTAPGTRQHASWNFQRCSVGDCTSGSGCNAPGVEDLEWPEAVRIMGWMTTVKHHWCSTSFLTPDLRLLAPHAPKFLIEAGLRICTSNKVWGVLILVRRPKRSTAVQKCSRRGGGGKAAGSQTWKQRTCWWPTKRLPAAAARGQAARQDHACGSPVEAVGLKD